MHAPGIAVKAVRERARQSGVDVEQCLREASRLGLAPRLDRSTQDRERLTPSGGQ
jgi:hypothetical protein